jgi:hypothetical protein
MVAGKLGDLYRVVEKTRAAMVADLVDLALGQSRVDDHRPGVAG